MSSRDQYKPNTLDPTFGQLFEMKVILPLEKHLVLTVIDYDKGLFIYQNSQLVFDEMKAVTRG